MANPELLLQSLKGYQERQQTAQRERNPVVNKVLSEFCVVM